jgi:hypothetical protein
MAQILDSRAKELEIGDSVLVPCKVLSAVIEPKRSILTLEPLAGDAVGPKTKLTINSNHCVKYTDGETVAVNTVTVGDQVVIK